MSGADIKISNARGEAHCPRWDFQVSDHKEIREILSKFDAVTAFHGDVHHTVYNQIGKLTSVGTVSTSWPCP